MQDSLSVPTWISDLLDMMFGTALKKRLMLSPQGLSPESAHNKRGDKDRAHAITLYIQIVDNHDVPIPSETWFTVNSNHTIGYLDHHGTKKHTDFQPDLLAMLQGLQIWYLGLRMRCVCWMVWVPWWLLPPAVVHLCGAKMCIICRTYPWRPDDFRERKKMKEKIQALISIAQNDPIFFGGGRNLVIEMCGWEVVIERWWHLDSFTPFFNSSPLKFHHPKTKIHLPTPIFLGINSLLVSEGGSALRPKKIGPLWWLP